MLLDDRLKSIAIKHGKHFALIGHLHGRGIVVTVAGNHILACTHSGYHELLTEFSGA